MNTPAEVAAPVHYGTQLGDAPWFAVARMVERHALGIAAFLLVPLNWPLFWLFLMSYVLRMVAFEALYHRYFAHRAFKANRVAQFVLTVFATQCGLRSPLWFAAVHRDHHKWPDTDKDVHSPTTKGFGTAYLGWMRDAKNLATDLDKVPDFAQYPEMRWLNRYYLVPLYLGGLALFLAGRYGLLGPHITGISALLWGFYAPTLLTLHAGGLIGTLTHMPRVPGNYRRYDTKDYSCNVPLIGLVTMGAGWHNNHHRYAPGARSGFGWWEIDISYYFLWLLSAVGIIRDVRGKVPEDILREGGYR